VIDYVNREVFDRPEEYYTLDKLRRAAAVDRRISLREILEKTFGLIPDFKSKDQLLEDEFAKFMADRKPDEASEIPAIRNYFKTCVTSKFSPSTLILVVSGIGPIPSGSYRSNEF